MSKLPKDAQHHNWTKVPRETLNADIDRQIVTGSQMMIAHVHLKKGAVVPLHDHHNEQLTYILSGALKFLLGEAQTDEVIVRAGEVLVIPPHLPHSAVALEDTLDVDVFSPPREDWLDGTDTYLRNSSSSDE